MCDAEEIGCLGRWDDDWTEQLTPDFCIPKKIGDCPTICPNDCCKGCPYGEVMCPGGYDDAGCKTADECIPEGSKCELIGPAK